VSRLRPSMVAGLEIGTREAIEKRYLHGDGICIGAGPELLVDGWRQSITPSVRFDGPRFFTGGWFVGLVRKEAGDRDTRARLRRWQAGRGHRGPNHRRGALALAALGALRPYIPGPLWRAKSPIKQSLQNNGRGDGRAGNSRCDGARRAGAMLEGLLTMTQEAHGADRQTRRTPAGKLNDGPDGQSHGAARSTGCVGMRGRHDPRTGFPPSSSNRMKSVSQGHAGAHRRIRQAVGRRRARRHAGRSVRPPMPRSLAPSIPMEHRKHARQRRCA